MLHKSQLILSVSNCSIKMSLCLLYLSHCNITCSVDSPQKSHFPLVWLTITKSCLLICIWPNSSLNIIFLPKCSSQNTSYSRLSFCHNSFTFSLTRPYLFSVTQHYIYISIFPLWSYFSIDFTVSPPTLVQATYTGPHLPGEQNDGEDVKKFFKRIKALQLYRFVYLITGCRVTSFNFA